MYYVSVKTLMEYMEALDLDCAARWMHLKDIVDRQDRVAEQRDGAVLPQQNLAVADETLTVSQAIDDLLGYLELDLENRELDNKEHWLEVFQVVHGWHNAAKF